MDVHGRDLRYFVAVAEHGTLTRAAQALHVSQPGLSRQLRALERQVGAELFVRRPDGMEPTAAGRTLLPHARRMLAGWDEAVRDLLAAAEHLVIGVSTGVGRELLPAIGSRLAERRPGASTEVRQVPWTDPTAGLLDATSDVAVIFWPAPGPLEHRVLAREPMVLALPADHPLARRATVAVADLLDEPFLALPVEAGPAREHWLLPGLRGGRPPRVGAVVRSVEETVEALLDHRGVVLLAAGNGPQLSREHVVLREVSGLPAAELVLAWRSDDRRPLVRDYVAAARDAVTGAPARH